MGFAPEFVEFGALAFASVQVLVELGLFASIGLGGLDLLEESVLFRAGFGFELGLVAVGFAQGDVHLDDVAQEGGVFLGVGLLEEPGQGNLANLLDLDGELGEVGFVIKEDEEGAVEVIQGIGDVPPVIEAREGGAGGADFEFLADVLKGLGQGASFEPSDDLLLLVFRQGFEGGVGVGLAHRFKI